MAWRRQNERKEERKKRAKHGRVIQEENVSIEWLYNLLLLLNYIMKCIRLTERKWLCHERESNWQLGPSTFVGFFFQLRDPVNRFLLFSRHFTSIVSCRARSFNEAIDSRSPAFHPARHHFHVVSRQQQKQLGRAVSPDTPAAHTGRMMDGAFPAPIGPSLVVGWD